MTDKEIINQWFLGKNTAQNIFSDTQESLTQYKNEGFKIIANYFNGDIEKDLNKLTETPEYKENVLKTKECESRLDELKKIKDLALEKEETEQHLLNDFILEEDEERRKLALHIILNKVNEYVFLNKKIDKKELLQGDGRRNDYINSTITQLEDTYNKFLNDFGFYSGLGSFESIFGDQEQISFMKTFKDIMDELKSFKNETALKKGSDKKYKHITRLKYNTSKEGPVKKSILKIIELYFELHSIKYKKHDFKTNINELINSHK